MVVMVVEKMSVEKMYRNQKKKASKAVEPVTPRNGGGSAEEDPVENSRPKKKKKQEVVELELEEVPGALSNGGLNAHDEPVEKMHQKKQMKKAELDFNAVKPSYGGASSANEAVENLHKEKKKKRAELEVSETTPSSGGIPPGEPLSAELEQNQDEDKEKERKEMQKKEKKEKNNKKKAKKEKKQKTGNTDKNVKGTTHTDKTSSASKVGEPTSSDGVKFGGDSVPEPVGMEIYWNLSSVDASVRETASVALVRELIGAQKDYEDRGETPIENVLQLNDFRKERHAFGEVSERLGLWDDFYYTRIMRLWLCLHTKGLGQEEKAAEAVILGKAKIEEEGLKDCAPAVQYALRRLVRGVASSRESARQGFALALASVLGALPSVNGAPIVKMVEKHLEVTSSMKGQEARDALLGQLFAFGALVRSSRVIGAANTVEEQELAKEVTERLLTLAKKKTFLQEAAAYVLVELVGKLEGSRLLKSVCASPHFSDSLREGADSISPDTLFVALSLHRKLPKSAFESCTVIPDSGNLIDIFEKDHLVRLLPCLKESTSSHPRVHSVWDLLLQILFSNGVHPKPSKKNKRSSDTLAKLETRLGTFWGTVVDGSLLTSSHERKHLAMQLLLMFLPRLPGPSYVQYILSSNFIQCLLGATASKENLLFKSAQNCIAELCKWAEGDDESRIRVVIAFQQSSQGKFDHFSKTHAVKGLLSGLTTITGYQLTFQALTGLYLSEETLEGDILVNSSVSSKKQNASIGDPAGDIRRDPGQQKWAVDQLRALCQQALSSLPPNIVIEELVAKFVPSLTPVQPFTEEEEESDATLQLTMLQVSSVVEPGDKKDRLQSMLSLLVQLLFESRLVPSIAIEIASEITICCKKAFGDLVELEVESKEDGEEPAFMDVLVDVLLSLLAQASAPIRVAAEQVFKSFSGDLTSSGLTDLLRIVKKDTQRSRHKPVVEVDMGWEAEDDILDVEESDADSGNENGTDEDDDNDDMDDDGDGDEEDIKVQASKENIRVPGKRSRDKSVAVEDNGEEDEGDEVEDEGKEGETSDLDDETMFRMDKHLANILKQRSQGGANGTDDAKDAQTQLMHFKFRVLTLLDLFLQKHSGSLLVLTMLPSLLHVFVNSCTTDGNSQVADRVSSILQNKLFKGKQYPKGPEVNQSNLKGLLRKALKLASRSTVKRVAMMAQATCHWILKVIHGNLKEEKDKDVEEMFSAALEDFFVHKKCRLPSSFFKETFTRNQWLGNCLLGAVLEKCTSARSQFLQFESLQLAGTILGFKNGKFLSRSKQPAASLDTMQPMARVLEPHLPNLSKAIVHLLKGAASAKAARRIESIQFCVSALELYQNLYPQKSLSKFVVSDSLVAALGEITAPGKSKLDILVVKVRQLLETKMES